jgi:Cys-tRNA(Pro) deacylase
LNQPLYRLFHLLRRYRDCQKYVSISERIFVTNPYAAVPLSEHYYDRRYKPDGEQMNRKDLQQFLDENEITATILSLPTHTATVADAAAALGVDADQIIKSLVFLVDQEPLLVINNGTARVDRRKVAAALGVGRKKVKFASPEQALAVTGYAVGAMPPFGHRTPLRTLVDRAVTSLAVVYGGGGSVDAMMRLAPGELIRATGAETLSLSE